MSSSPTPTLAVTLPCFIQPVRQGNSTIIRKAVRPRSVMNSLVCVHGPVGRKSESLSNLQIRWLHFDLVRRLARSTGRGMETRALRIALVNRRQHSVRPALTRHSPCLRRNQHF
jgi:hypothetical protein